MCACDEATPVSDRFHFQVFTSLYIGLPPRGLVRESAEEFVRQHPEFTLEVPGHSEVERTGPCQKY